MQMAVTALVTSYLMGWLLAESWHVFRHPIGTIFMAGSAYVRQNWL